MTLPIHSPTASPTTSPRSSTPGALAAGGPIERAVLSRFGNALAIYAFGSQVQGGAGPESDLDLAVLVPGYAPPLGLWELSGALADIAGCPVDLMDLRAASTVMQYQIITKGRCIWSVGLEAGLFESFVLSEMTDLNAARAGLLQDIQRDGRIHVR